MDDLDAALADLLAGQAADDRALLWSWIQRALNETSDLGDHRDDSQDDPAWVEEIYEQPAGRLVDLALAAIDALDHAHGQPDPRDGFSGIRTTLLFSSAPVDRLALRGALDLAAEIAAVRRRSGLVAATDHLRGPLGAPDVDELGDLCHQLLDTVVFYTVTRCGTGDPATVRAALDAQYGPGTPT